MQNTDVQNTQMRERRRESQREHQRAQRELIRNNHELTNRVISQSGEILSVFISDLSETEHMNEQLFNTIEPGEELAVAMQDDDNNSANANHSEQQVVDTEPTLKRKASFADLIDSEARKKIKKEQRGYVERLEEEKSQGNENSLTM